MSEIILYNNGELELPVSLGKETVWLNRNQLSELFERDVKTIGKHIANVFKDKELVKGSVVANFATTASDGKTYSVEHYNLDVIIDQTRTYLIGASLKDAGKKTFAFSKMNLNIRSPKIMNNE